jgi:hypothetical protein
MFQIQCYLRWCANLEKPFANINDLEDEVKHPENFEATIRFENLEWTFSCSNNDLIGHKGTSSNFSHYHFQMKINNLPFIKFNDFHIPLSEYDLFNFNLFKKHGEKFKHTFGRGSSIKQVLQNVEPEDIINMSVSGDPGAKSTYHFSNIIFPNEGELLDGSVVADLIKKSKKTGLPIAKLVKEIPNINVSTIISPSDDIPEHNLRDGRGKKK